MDLEQIDSKGICQCKEQIVNIINYHPTAAGWCDPWVQTLSQGTCTSVSIARMDRMTMHTTTSQNDPALPEPGMATAAARVKPKVSLFILSWSLFPCSTHGLVHGMKGETIYPDSSSFNWAKVYSQNNFCSFLLSRKCYLVTVRFSFAALHRWLLLTKTLSQLHWW